MFVFLLLFVCSCFDILFYWCHPFLLVLLIVLSFACSYIALLVLTFLQYSQERPGGSNTNIPIKRLKITCHGDTLKRALFEEPDQVAKPASSSSKKTSSTALVGTSNAAKDMTTFEWAIHYHESARKLLLVLGKITSQCVLERGHAFTYGKIVRFDYEDNDSTDLRVKVETSKGERTIKVSKYMLVYSTCEPLELQKVLTETDNMIVILQTFIFGDVSFADSVEASFVDREEENVERMQPMPVP